jgi:hypothetical protein
MEKIKELLLTIRNQKILDMITEEEVSEGYFAIYDHVGGNVDDAFEMGKEVGEAELVEILLRMLEE